MSTTFVEKLTTTLEPRFSRMPEPMKVHDPVSDPKVLKRLAQYLDYWMTKNGWTKIIQVEQRAAKLGVNKGVSDATVGNILNQKPFEMKVGTLRNLAITLGRPPEELFAIAIGKDAKKPAEEPEELSSLKEIYNALPEADQAFYLRQIIQLIRNMCSTD